MVILISVVLVRICFIKFFLFLLISVFGWLGVFNGIVY